MLAAGLDGIERKLPPPEPVEENLYHFDARQARAPQDPAAARHARARRSTSCARTRSSRDALGEHVFERFVEAKTEEWDEYRMQVSSWELDRYLEAF